MNALYPSSALRELRDHLAGPVTLAALAAAAVVLGISGPFGTFDAMTLPARLAYWAAIVGLTWTTGAAVSILLRPRVAGWSAAVRVLLVALAVTGAVSLVLLALSLAVGPGLDGPGTLAQSLAATFAICLAIETVGEIAARRHPAPREALAASLTAAPLMARLPLDRRGGLVALSVTDHYVHVATTRGRTMLLMRLSDAIAETAPVPGLQVHRSHWVATEAVRSARRQGEGAVLTLSDGAEVPVSRAGLTLVRAAGFLPRRGT